MHQLLDVVHLSVGALVISVTLLILYGHRLRLGHPARSALGLVGVLAAAE
jgi:hypothetical protein